MCHKGYSSPLTELDACIYVKGLIQGLLNVSCNNNSVSHQKSMCQQFRQKALFQRMKGHPRSYNSTRILIKDV